MSFWGTDGSGTTGEHSHTEYLTKTAPTQTITPTANDAATFRIENSGGVDIFWIDTTTNRTATKSYFYVADYAMYFGLSRKIYHTDTDHPALEFGDTRQDGLKITAKPNHTTLNGYGLQILSTYTQGGTSGSSDLYINRTETTIGSGEHYLIRTQKDFSDVFNVDSSGKISTKSTTTQAEFFNSSDSSKFEIIKRNDGFIELKSSNGISQIFGSKTLLDEEEFTLPYTESVYGSVWTKEGEHYSFLMSDTVFDDVSFGPNSTGNPGLDNYLSVYQTAGTMHVKNRRGATRDVKINVFIT